MANIKLTGNTWDTSSVYDKTEGKTQKQINAALASAVSSQAEETTELKTAKAPVVVDSASASGILRIKDGAENMKVKKVVLDSTGLTSATVTICGKNLNKTIKNGYYDRTTGEFTSNNTWRATDFIRCNVGEQFVASSGTAFTTIFALFYGETGNYLSNQNVNGRIIVVPENAYYMAFYGNRTSFEDNFQIESGTVATKYEAYRENTAVIDFGGTQSESYAVNNPDLVTYHGANSVWYANDGITLEYCADTGLYVEKNNEVVSGTMTAVEDEIKRIYVFNKGDNKCKISVGDKIKITNNSTTNNASSSTKDIYGEVVESVSANIPPEKSIIFTASAKADVLYLYSTDSTATFTVEFLGTVDARLDQLEAYHENPVPEYFRTMIAATVESVRTNMMNVGKNGDTFVFVTDLHWENNRKNSPQLVKYVLDHLNINKIFCGGDLITQGERDVMAADMLDCVKAFTFPDTMLPIAFGNHDSNWVDYGSQRTDPTRKFDINAVYALICKQCEPYVTFMTDTDCSLYFDNDDDKTRYIFLDTGEDDAEGRDFSAFDELASVLNATPSGYNIVTVAHIVTYGLFKTGVEPMLDAYNSKGTYTYDGTTYNFNSATGHVVLGIGGHTHEDSSHTTTGGIPIVVTTCDRIKETSEEGTTSEQAFEVVTLDYTNNKAYFVRVGRGSNRTFDLG